MTTRGHKMFVAIVCITSIAMLTMHCRGGDGTNTDKSKDLVSASTAFGLSLYREILSDYAMENVFISPASIALALAMTYNGAAGTTEQAMARTLELEGMSLQEINDAGQILLNKLQDAGPDVELSIANSLWLKRDFKFHKDFIQRNRTYFGAEVFNHLDASEINDWVKANTKGKIEKIIDRISSNDIACLVNAIYLKGIWTKEFDEGKTKDEIFHLPDGEEKKIPMMKQSGKYLYLKGEGFQAASLPYGDGRTSMYVFLPDRDSSLETFNTSVSPENWNKWMSGFVERDGHIALPRFKVKFRISLKKTLKELGMDVAFSPNHADFSNMCSLSSGNVYISDVLHKTFLEVNEEGTEAAAATGVVMKLTSVQTTEEPFRMVVDRPFFIAIRNNETGLILFMGSILDPD
jgi:serine protease inhibitor